MITGAIAASAAPSPCCSPGRRQCRILYLCEHEMPNAQKGMREGGRPGDRDGWRPGVKRFCDEAVQKVIDEFGGPTYCQQCRRAAPRRHITDITAEQLSGPSRPISIQCSSSTQAARPHLKKSAAIIIAPRSPLSGSKGLLDYSSTKARSRPSPARCRKSDRRRNSRQRGCAGPIWTPLNPMGGLRRKDQGFLARPPMGSGRAQ